jgi:hypothetical protein
MAEKLDKSTPDSAWKKVLSAQEASGSSVVAGVAAAADYFHLQAGCSSAWTRMVFASRGCTQRVTWQAWWYEFGSCFFPAAIAVCNLLLLQHTPGVRPCKTVCNGIVDPGNVSCGVCVCVMWCVCVCVCVLQFHILREKGTEPPGSGQYNKFYEQGLYKCAGCGTPLYK